MRPRRPTEWVFAPGVTRLDPARAGFWRSILRAPYAERVWAKVSSAVRAGWLAPAARLEPWRDGRTWELRLYVRDVHDEAQVRRLRVLLRRELGFVRPLACYDWAGTRRWCDPGAEADTPARLARRSPRRRGASGAPRSSDASSDRGGVPPA
jgi:hypothetical protein